MLGFGEKIYESYLVDASGQIMSMPEGKTNVEYLDTVLRDEDGRYWINNINDMFTKIDNYLVLRAPSGKVVLIRDMSGKDICSLPEGTVCALQNKKDLDTEVTFVTMNVENYTEYTLHLFTYYGVEVSKIKVDTTGGAFLGKAFVKDGFICVPVTPFDYDETEQDEDIYDLYIIDKAGKLVEIQHYHGDELTTLKNEYVKTIRPAFEEVIPYTIEQFQPGEYYIYDKSDTLLVDEVFTEIHYLEGRSYGYSSCFVAKCEDDSWKLFNRNADEVDIPVKFEYKDDTLFFDNHKIIDTNFFECEDGVYIGLGDKDLTEIYKFTIK